VYLLSKWQGKYVIGLTGNIATGKSVVRRMLEHLGAYGIDADALSHRAIAKGAPGFQPVVETFGKWILDDRGSVDRTRLGRLVFSDPQALTQLEDIVHPLVYQAIDILIKRSIQPVIVIEAIKLLESELSAACDAIWATYSPEVVQISRLMEKRRMDYDEARRRIETQNPQADKLAAALVVIRNTGSFAELWKQVTTEWKKLSPVSDTSPVVSKPAKAGDFVVQRGRPRDSVSIAAFISSQAPAKQTVTSDDVMAAFGEKAYMLLQMNNQLVGLAGWQVENLVSRTTEMYISPTVPLEKTLETLIGEIESASKDLQCEASLLFLPPELVKHEAIWAKLGYERRTPQVLGVQAWQDAAKESMQEGMSLLFKLLRQDRVLLPI
jgi:dephospho-CoA kinase